MDERFPEVPKEDVKRVEGWLEELEFEPLLSELMHGIKAKGIEKDVRVLSGEDQDKLKEDLRVRMRNPFFVRLDGSWF